MIGPDGHLHRWSALRKLIQRILTINPARACLSDCVTSRFFRFLCCFFLGSVCAPDKATLKAENHAFQCTTAGPYHAVPSHFLGVGSIRGLGHDRVGIHSISLAARYRVAACSTTLNQDLEKIQTGRGHNCTPICALSPVWEKEFHVPSMACSIADALGIVCLSVLLIADGLLS